MGTPLPPNPIGSNCINCWGTGKPFGAGPTPEIVTITLFDLQEGDFWNDVVGAEAQVPTQLFQTDTPCRWHADSATIDWELRLFATDTSIFIVDKITAKPIFIIFTVGPCLLTGPNREVGPFDNFAFGGFFELTFSGVFT